MAGDAGGIFMNEPTEAPPRTQPFEPRQISTESVSPSETRRNMEKPSRDAGSTTFSTAPTFNAEGNLSSGESRMLEELARVANELAQPFRDAIQ